MLIVIKERRGGKGIGNIRRIRYYISSLRFFVVEAIGCATSHPCVPSITGFSRHDFTFIRSIDQYFRGFSRVVRYIALKSKTSPTIPRILSMKLHNGITPVLGIRLPETSRTSGDVFVSVVYPCRGIQSLFNPLLPMDQFTSRGTP